MDDQAYERAVIKELEQDDVREWLWKDALAQSDGDETQARALYIPMRVRQMKERHAEYAEQIQTLRDRAKRRKTWGTVLVALGVVAMAIALFSVFDRPFMGLMYAGFFGVVMVMPGAFMLRESKAVRKEADQLAQESAE